MQLYNNINFLRYTILLEYCRNIAKYYLIQKYEYSCKLSIIFYNIFIILQNNIPTQFQQYFVLYGNNYALDSYINNK